MSASPASTLFNNLSALLPEVSVLLLSAGALAGIILVAMAGFKWVEQQRVQYSGESTNTPFWYALAGTILFNASLSIGTISVTLLGDSPEVRSMIGYTGGAGLPSQSRQLLMVIVAITQIAGLIFWLKGVFDMRLISAGRSDVTGGSVAARIIGGTLMMHIVVFVNTIGSLVGFSSILD